MVIRPEEGDEPMRKKVLRGWESLSGWYWFGIEIDRFQNTVVDGTLYEDDPIWFGLIQGQTEELGYFSEGELKTLEEENRVWEINERDLPHAGRRERS